MFSHRKISYLFVIFLFFSCQSIQPATESTVRSVLTGECNSISYSGYFITSVSQVSLPEILGVPVEIVPIEVHRNDNRKNDYYTEPATSSETDCSPKYVAVSRIILPGLSSTEIGYPFHAFW